MTQFRGPVFIRSWSDEQNFIMGPHPTPTTPQYSNFFGLAQKIGNVPAFLEFTVIADRIRMLRCRVTYTWLGCYTITPGVPPDPDILDEVGGQGPLIQWFNDLDDFADLPYLDGLQHRLRRRQLTTLHPTVSFDIPTYVSGDLRDMDSAHTFMQRPVRSPWMDISPAGGDNATNAMHGACKLSVRGQQGRIYAFSRKFTMWVQVANQR